jgi:hypothetical protein
MSEKKTNQKEQKNDNLSAVEKKYVTAGWSVVTSDAKSLHMEISLPQRRTLAISSAPEKKK